MNISGTALASEDLLKFAELLKKGDYRYLQELDVSNNRLQGVTAGQAINMLLTREIDHSGGYSLQNLNLSQNKLMNDGAELVFQALTSPTCYLKHFNAKCISITTIAGIVVVPPVLLTTRTKLETLILDENEMRPRS